MVSVIIPVLNDAAGITTCLDALAAQVDAPPFEVIVVDNGSSDGSRQAAQDHAIGATALVEARRGSYAARNTGIRAAAGGMLAFTDADCIPDSRWLAHGLAALQASDLAAGRVKSLGSGDPSPWEVWDAAHYLDQEAYVGENFSATANLFARSRAFQDVGLFDPELRSSGDLDWGKRATGAGFTLVYAPNAVVAHRPRTSLAGTWRLHRRLGAGWRALAKQGKRPLAHRDPYLRPAYQHVRAAALSRGLPVEDGSLRAVHAVVVAARWTGWLTGR